MPLMSVRELEAKAGSCPRIVFINGERAAVPFKSQSRKVRPTSRSQVISEAHETFRLRKLVHLGTRLKPLMRYSPDAPRSRLPTKDFIAPNRNSSSFSLGQSNKNTRQFVTTSKAMLKVPIYDVLTNPGILSDHAKWRHSRMYR
mmetsp:Transcript_2592/g.5875  ORF Transcript_2592/g.5875 Transcript_2592/m.5875 type:complete len:144 (-) Transcript_2592:3199-3630(-)